MKLVTKYGKIEIWAVTESHGIDYYVYGVRRDAVVCPSIGMARAVAASAA